MSDKIEALKAKLREDGVSVAELLEAEDPVVMTIRVCIPREEGCPVRGKRLRESEVAKLPWISRQKLSEFRHDGKAPKKDGGKLEDAPEESAHLDVAGTGFEDIRRALEAH